MLNTKRSSLPRTSLVASRFVIGVILPLVLIMGVFAFPSAYAQRTGSSGPHIWLVSVGGQSPDGAVQGEAYYPHVITVDVKIRWCGLSILVSLTRSPSSARVPS